VGYKPSTLESRAAHASWVNTVDRTARTANARSALEAKFLAEALSVPVVSPTAGSGSKKSGCETETPRLDPDETGIDGVVAERRVQQINGVVSKQVEE
jgi:hypothetical protein